VLPFQPPEVITAAEDAGLRMLASERDTLQAWAPDLRSLLADIKTLGAHQTGAPRRRAWARPPGPGWPPPTRPTAAGRPARLLRHLLAHRRETPMTAYFITGTDTEIGKTFVTCTLLHAARARGLRPRHEAHRRRRRNGGRRIHQRRRRPPARRRQLRPRPRAAQPLLPRQPHRPHIAAAEEGVAIEPGPSSPPSNAQAQADVVLVEGVGGFRVPLGDDYDTADLARDLALPVILVVGMRLGCINHALLTAEAIQPAACLAGWVANQVDPAMLRFRAESGSPQGRMPAPLLGVCLPARRRRRSRQRACPTGLTRRWRSCSNRHTPAATPTLRDSMPPGIGISTRGWPARPPPRQALPSEPNSQATGPRRSRS
jgi:dethiobiotin synthetase